MLGAPAELDLDGCSRLLGHRRKELQEEVGGNRHLRESTMREIMCNVVHVCHTVIIGRRTHKHEYTERETLSFLYGELRSTYEQCISPIPGNYYFLVLEAFYSGMGCLLFVYPSNSTVHRCIKQQNKFYLFGFTLASAITISAPLVHIKIGLISSKIRKHKLNEIANENVSSQNYETKL